MEYYQQMQASKLQESKNKHPPKNNCSRDTCALNQAAAPSMQRTPVSDKTQADKVKVEQWLLSQLPHLRKDDALEYATQLHDLGFDSVAFIEDELIEEDLTFMKTAHRRVVMRQLSEIRAEKDTK